MNVEVCVRFGISVDRAVWILGLAVEVDERTFVLGLGPLHFTIAY